MPDMVVKSDRKTSHPFPYYFAVNLFVNGEPLGRKGLRTVIVYSKLMNVKSIPHVTVQMIIFFCY